MAATQLSPQELAATSVGEYRYGFHEEVSSVFRTKGRLDEDVVREISVHKSEPEWMTEFRFNAYRNFVDRELPGWGADLSVIDFDRIYYYLKPVDVISTACSMKALWANDRRQLDAGGGRPGRVDLASPPLPGAHAAYLRNAPKRARVAQHPAPRLSQLRRLVQARPGRVRRRDRPQRDAAGTGRNGGDARPLPDADPGVNSAWSDRGGCRPKRLLPPGGVGTQQALATAALRNTASSSVVAAYSLGQQLILAAWDITLGLLLLWTAIGWTATRALIHDQTPTPHLARGLPPPRAGGTAAPCDLVIRDTIPLGEEVAHYGFGSGPHTTALGQP